MNHTGTVLSVLAILALTFGTGVFVAAEFSLTALDRSTVEANARGGASRDRFIQRAHHRLSFQLSGAQLGISITTLATGYLTEPLVALQTQVALALGGGPAAGWEPPLVAPLGGLPARTAWLHAQDRGPEAEKLVEGIARLHPEAAAGWWLSVRFWLAPIRAWVS